MAEGSRGLIEKVWGWVDGLPGSRFAGRGPTIGLALGGGFARGIAHVGVLRVFEKHNIPINFIGGVSAGAIVAAFYASGASSYDLEKAARAMAFKDVARWTLSRLGFVASERMERFLRHYLKTFRFQDMKIPLAVVATDLASGEPVVFCGRDEVFLPVRASCSYPGLFEPVRISGRYLVDGAISMEVPALPVRRMGATRIISVGIQAPSIAADPRSVFAVVNRCFQIMQRRTENDWRQHSDLILTPDVSGVGWDEFLSVDKMIEAGERSATEALPIIRRWLARGPRRSVELSQAVSSPETPAM
jgi:NTE family protein